MGNRDKNLLTALNLLQALGGVGPVSPVYRTAPVGMPPETPAFHNLATRLESNLSPQNLLTGIKKIEREMGRIPAHGPPRSRPIDIDILTANGRIVASPALTIPHPRMWDRAFVVFPMADIAPHLANPHTRLTMAQTRQNFSAGDAVERLGKLPLLSRDS